MYANNLFTLNNVSPFSTGTEPNPSGPGRKDDAMPLCGSDVVFVNVVQYGRTLLDRAFTGFSCLTELIGAVKDCLGTVYGLVTINFRNRTCGCATRRVVRLSRGSSMPMPSVNRI